MRKFLLVTLVALGFNANAQTPDSTRKIFAPVDIYHGVTAGASASNIVGIHAGYYLDLHMRKYLYLFTKYNIHYYKYNAYDDRRQFTLTPSFCFAFRLNGDSKRWNYFPYIGTSLNLASYYTGNWIYPGNRSSYFDINMTPSLMAGFEVKYRLKDKYNIGLGAEIDTYEGRMRVFVKFGCNRQYKK